MKNLLIFSILIFLCSNIQAQKIVRALFIGNSYTYVNNLPQTIADMALSKGDSLIFDSNAPGGYTFQMHSTDVNTLAKIAQGGWDYVILQAQSQEPSFSPAQVATDVLPYAEILDSLIHVADSCTQTIFFMTWGRKNGDASNCAFYPPVCTYAGMQQRLRESYLLMAQMFKATAAPIGCAWRDVRATNPLFDLYQADESHPSEWGTYLAANVFYSVMFQKSPVGSNFYSTIPQSDAQFLQTMAATSVHDSLSQWCGNGNIPFASFSKSINGNSVQFTSTTLNGLTYKWYFGDGDSSISINPQHTFLSSGNFVTRLVASNNCLMDEVVDTIKISPTAIQNQNPENEISVFVSDNFLSTTIQGNTIETFILKIFDLNGKTFLQKSLKRGIENNIDLSILSHGIYFYTISTNSAGLIKTGKFTLE